VSTHPLATVYELCSQAGAAATRMDQEELDVLGQMLDRLEEVEIHLETNLSRKERFDTLVEFNTLTDRISAMIDRV
jgi:hypothetical protein